MKIRSLTKDHTSGNTLQGGQGLNSDQMEKCEKEKGPPKDQDRDKDKDRGSLEADVRETALARYIVARWKTPRVKLVCSLPFPSLWIFAFFPQKVLFRYSSPLNLYCCSKFGLKQIYHKIAEFYIQFCLIPYGLNQVNLN